MRNALGDPATFSSKAVAFNPKMNEILTGTSLAADPPQHGDLRAVLTDNLSPRAMRSMKDSIYAKADELVRDLVARGSFDGMADLAVAFPVSSSSLDLYRCPGRPARQDPALGRGRAQPARTAEPACAG